MFTGLIKELATVVSFNNNILTLQAQHKPNIGDSIAVNGACLTVVYVDHGIFSVELSLESQKILAMENYKNLVHIEPAMMMNDRFEGHIVQGHIDCVGTIKNINDNGNSKDFIVELPKEYLKYIIPKGSIAIDGISLTINEIYDNSFRLTIIPHTIKNTLFQTYNIDTRVNIETDMFARYIFNMFHKDKQNSTLSWEQVDMMMNRY
jgi:riboflavin synthase